MKFIEKVKYWSARGSREKYYQEKEKLKEKKPWIKEEINESLKVNIANFEKYLGNSADIKTHQFRFVIDKEYDAIIYFLDGLVSSFLINDNIVTPFMARNAENQVEAEPISDILDYVDKKVIFSGDTQKKKKLDDVFQVLLYGDAVLMIDGSALALTISCKTWEKRSVGEPQSKATIRGPREGFTENFRTNTALLRRRLKTPQLRLDHLTVGARTDTYICVAYIEDIAQPAIVDEVKKRLECINVDSILDAGYIEQYIEDSPFSIFPTVGYSEKPDEVAARLLEGRIGIIVDGSPFVLTVPMLFLESFQTAEDYYVRTIFATISRILRYAAFVLATLTPAIFIALVSFHQEMIPTKLLFTIANSWESTPFPAFIETIILVFAFEVLREAGLRLPRPVGQSIGIVSALIIGDAAVSAGIVGAPTVFVVAVTAVASYVVPEQYEAVVIVRLLLLVLTAIFGAFGMAVGIVALVIHLCKLKSFGVPYVAGLFSERGSGDGFVREPLWAMNRRPEIIGERNLKRRSFFIPPIKKDEIDEDESSSKFERG